MSQSETLQTLESIRTSSPSLITLLLPVFEINKAQETPLERITNLLRQEYNHASEMKSKMMSIL